MARHVEVTHRRGRVRPGFSLLGGNKVGLTSDMTKVAFDDCERVPHPGGALRLPAPL
jgi:hypothetical protein